MMHFLAIVIFVLLSAEVQSTIHINDDRLDQHHIRGSPCVWSPWSEPVCNASCDGVGVLIRTRKCSCNTASLNDNDVSLTTTASCEGESVMVVDGVNVECIGERCCQWNEWNEWSSCSNDCGKGTQTRQRRCSCQEGHPDSTTLRGCEGEEVDVRTCESSRGCVDVDNNSECVFDEWSSWSSCSESCHGLRYRRQVCRCGDERLSNDLKCKGIPLEETEVCNVASQTEGCCEWEWLDSWWSNVNATCCPEGKTWRRQACVCPGHAGVSHDSLCSRRGPFEQERVRCTVQPPCKPSSSASSECVWKSTWGPWSTCDPRSGLRYRTRKCSCGDPQRCDYPAPLQTESCVAAGSPEKHVGVWIERNVVTRCDTSCGVGGYWVGATCLCHNVSCDLSHCHGIPETYEESCVGTDCPTDCAWEVTVSECKGECSRSITPPLGVHTSFGFEVEEVEVEVEVADDDEERLFLEERKMILQKVREEGFKAQQLLQKRHLQAYQTITRRCKCGGVEVNSEFCSPALSVYEVKPCTKDCSPSIIRRVDSSCAWMEWSSWSPCEGVEQQPQQQRNRNCFCADESKDKACKGSHVEQRLCSMTTSAKSFSIKEDHAVALGVDRRVFLLVCFVVLFASLSVLFGVLALRRHLHNHNPPPSITVLHSSSD